jgi:hypothetical protein
VLTTPIQTIPERHGGVGTTAVAPLPGYRTLVPRSHEPFTPAELLAEPHGFKAWLIHQPPTIEVGYSESIYGCPLATYLGSEGVQAWVGHDKTGGDDFTATPLPAWAQRFVRLVDMNTYHALRASYALALLNQVEREMAA